MSDGANPKDACALFEAFLATRGLSTGSMVPREGIDAMLDFFRTQRFEFSGTDSLLFQYGTYGPYGPEYPRWFDLDITRQLAVNQQWDDDSEYADIETDDDDHEYRHHDSGIWQLNLTFFYPPAPPLDDVEIGNRWCESESPEAVTAFEAFIRTSASYLVVADAQPTKVELNYQDAC
jgi:hypothetical protein